jgi:hypothetical protein
MPRSKPAETIVLTDGDLGIIDQAVEANNPSIFTNYYMRSSGNGYYVYPGSVRYEQYMKVLASRGQAIDKGNGNFKITTDIAKIEFIASSSEVNFPVKPIKLPSGEIGFFEERGALLLPWGLEFHRCNQEEIIIIGLAGTGKTLNTGLLAMFMCATIPNFRFLNVAPTLYQSNLMVRAIDDMTRGTLFREKFLLPGKAGWKTAQQKVIITFKNGSTAEFMNVANNAVNIQSWYGDWIHLDEAGLLADLDETGTEQLANIMIGLATRLRGTRPDGRPRLGRLSMTSMAYDCDTMWDRYEAGLKKGNTSTWSRLVLHNENPYLTPKDIERMRRNVPAGQEGQWLRGERPQRKNAEFPPAMLDPLISKTQWENAVKHADDPGWRIDFSGPGVIRYEEPYIPGHIYVQAGDPGVGGPPDRNSPTIMVFDVTSFPYEKARLAAFWWGDGGGSYTPFINTFHEYYARYRVMPEFRGYDSTSSQKALAELAFTSGEGEVVPLGFEGQKKWEYLSALKLLLSRQVLQIPDGIEGIIRQLRRYCLPDKKIPQDIVAVLSMIARLIYPLYLTAYPEQEEDDEEETGVVIAQVGRYSRPYSRRHYGR